jgi:tryptophan synthase alpha chain
VSERLKNAFAHGPALVTYVMAGDPDLATSRAMALACVEGGADVVELGMPFSDPIADGLTLQQAAERALAKGTRVEDCLELAAQLRRRVDTPLVLMGYVNPVLTYGERRFFRECRSAGVDAVILPDVPPEEASELRTLAGDAGVGTVFLLAPTSTPERQRAAAEASTGFVYFVSVTGVTGARRSIPKTLANQVREVRRLSPVPVVVGFGIGDPAQARAVARYADGVVVGSAIVSRVAQGGTRATRANRVRAFVRSLKRALP